MLETTSASEDAPFAPQAIRQMRFSMLFNLPEGRLTGVTRRLEGIHFGVDALIDRDLLALSYILLSRSYQRIVMPSSRCGAAAT